MILRSGFVKVPKCFKCKNFYSNSDWNFECSNCSGLSSIKNYYIYDTPAFQEELKTWVDKRLIDNHIKLCLKFASRTHMDAKHEGLLKGILNQIKSTNKYISAELGEELLRRTGLDSVQKSHLICPFILDWWNMSKYNFKRYELCYYGRYGDNPAIYIKQIPPPLPYSSIIS